MSTPGQHAQSPALGRLIDAASRGDESAWRDLIGLYSRRVYALARSRCGRDDLAEEVTQSVFVTVAEKLKSSGYREEGRFESWLFRIAVNRLRDEVRRMRRQADVADPESLAAIADGRPGPNNAPSTGESELAALRAAMERLGEADREIIQLRHHASMSFKQMAELLDEPVGTLLARHHRALQKLRELITVDASAASAAPRGGRQ